jgi:rare lipoprotein A
VPAVRASLFLLFLAACGGAQRPAAPGEVERGLASWYGGKLDGSKTASGERFDQDALTAAHRTLPFGAVVRVTNLRNERAVTVRINDRGPYGRGRVIDVSRAAARALDMIVAGVVPVTVEVLRLPARP